MPNILKPPTPLTAQEGSQSVFLAGSIEMGVAEDWQQVVTAQLEDTDITIYNPRRDEWDSSWEQSIENPVFRQQVEWELAAQEMADMIIMYFAPSTQSPITLLELGLFAHSKKLVVCCPEGFWRKGNVDVVCNRYGIPMVDTSVELVAAVRSRLVES